MAFHTVAFSATVPSVNLGTLVTPVVDNTVTIQGNNLLIPSTYNQLYGAAPFAPASSTVTSVQAQTPSLREMWFPNLTPVTLGATFAGKQHVVEWFDNPIPLETNEGLNIESDALLAAASGAYGSIVFLSDGKRQPISSQRIFTMRVTAAAALTVNTWVNAPVVFDQTLPVADYELVGLRAEGTGLLCARTVFIGASAITRPGVPGVAAATDIDLIEFRGGRMGSWGRFNSLTPPSFDFLGASGTSQVLYLDLIQR